MNVAYNMCWVYTAITGFADSIVMLKFDPLNDVKNRTTVQVHAGTVEY